MNDTGRMALLLANERRRGDWADADEWRRDPPARRRAAAAGRRAASPPTRPRVPAAPPAARVISAGSAPLEVLSARRRDAHHPRRDPPWQQPGLRRTPRGARTPRCRLRASRRRPAVARPRRRRRRRRQEPPHRGVRGARARRPAPGSPSAAASTSARAACPMPRSSKRFRGLARQLDDDGTRRRSSARSTDVFGLIAPRPRDRRSAASNRVDPAGRLARLFEAVLGTLGRASEERPLVLVIEDLHWADGSTRDLLRFLVRNMRSERLLIVATYRSDDLHRRHPLRAAPRRAGSGGRGRADRARRLRSRRDARAARRDPRPAGRTPAMVDALLERSDGLPFYVEELVAGGRTGAELPSTLRDILGSRLATLSPRDASVVRAAAVVGGRFPHDRLAAASGEDEDALDGRACDEAIDAGIVVSIDDGGDAGLRASAMPCSGRRPTRISCPPNASGCTRGWSTISPVGRGDRVAAGPVRSSPSSPSTPTRRMTRRVPSSARSGPSRPSSAADGLSRGPGPCGARPRALAARRRRQRTDGHRATSTCSRLAARIASATNQRERATALLQAALARGPDDDGPGAPGRAARDPARDRLGSRGLRCQRGGRRGGLRAGRAGWPQPGARPSRC